MLEEQKRILMEAIRRLPERERTIVELTYFYRKTSAEVAQKLHMTAGNVRVTLNRSLKKLRLYLEEDGWE